MCKTAEEIDVALNRCVEKLNRLKKESKLSSDDSNTKQTQFDTQIELLKRQLAEKDAIIETLAAKIDHQVDDKSKQNDCEAQVNLLMQKLVEKDKIIESLTAKKDDPAVDNGKQDDCRAQVILLWQQLAEKDKIIGYFLKKSESESQMLPIGSTSKASESSDETAAEKFHSAILELQNSICNDLNLIKSIEAEASGDLEIDAKAKIEALEERLVKSFRVYFVVDFFIDAFERRRKLNKGEQLDANVKKI